jgi:hypothetical protein
MDDFVRIALSKGARARITSTDYGFYIEVIGFGRILGKFKFNKDKGLISKLVIEKDFYPLELAKYELSKVNVGNVCNECGREFNTKRGLKTHIARTHNL